MQVQFKKGEAAKIKDYALAHPECVKAEVYFNKEDGSLILALPDSSTLGSEELDFYDYIKSQTAVSFKI